MDVLYSYKAGAFEDEKAEPHLHMDVLIRAMHGAIADGCACCVSENNISDLAAPTLGLVLTPVLIHRLAVYYTIKLYPKNFFNFNLNLFKTYSVLISKQSN
jgi:hypothetical protein